ncbi:hypothetical protein RMQ97_06195 [Maricaulis sp. D1M11]|uniref:hypothetical protein n=1 Tax=Maricaulis sp. D1M11 TaxID=3076117 RepID=UPI0039B3AA7F
MVEAVEHTGLQRSTRVIRDAANATGADFDFLLRTAARESNFDPAAQARTSSAAGMFQFIEQTWLGVMQRHGAAHGHGELSQAIETSAGGRLSVSDPDTRQALLDLRFDAGLSARMAAELASENAAVLQSRIGREPSSGELYAAHFLGASGAADLIQAADQAPDAPADQYFPRAADTNRPIFYEHGTPRSLRDVLARLTEERPVNLPVEPAVQATDTVPAMAQASEPQGYFTPSVVGYTSGELSPLLVELLASMDLPFADKDREW